MPKMIFHPTFFNLCSVERSLSTVSSASAESELPDLFPRQLWEKKKMGGLRIKLFLLFDWEKRLDLWLRVAGKPCQNDHCFFIVFWLCDASGQSLNSRTVCTDNENKKYSCVCRKTLFYTKWDLLHFVINTIYLSLPSLPSSRSNHCDFQNLELQ